MGRLPTLAQHKLYMTSYLVYSLAIRSTVVGFDKVGIFGMIQRQNLVYHFYPQLDHQISIQHYKRVNDVFEMWLIRTLEVEK